MRIRGAPVRQNLGMILENKVVQKLKLEKKSFLQKIGTARPRDTRPRGARTLEIHGF